MKDSYIDYLLSCTIDLEAITSELQVWANINSGSGNLEGLEQMLQMLKRSFAKLGCQIDTIPLPTRQKMDASGKVIDVQVGNALQMTQRPELKRRILLTGHMDTVYSPSGIFQNCEMLTPNKMRGPGVTDMKGGLLIMLKALELFEGSPWAKEMGWDVLITPDEEVGSPSSEELILSLASRCQLGLIFEPAFSDGRIVSARKGSANYAVVARGKSAHAGRDFAVGRNAIIALARFAVEADALNNRSSGTTLNFGHIEGGGAVNIVPDLAIGRVNIRAETTEELLIVDKLLHELAKEASKAEGITVEIFQEGFRTPKPFDAKTEHLFQQLKECGRQLGQEIDWRPSGGVCDGNILAMAGIPCIDTLGAVGGNIHTHDEYIDLESMPQRAKLAALLLMHLAKTVH